MRDILTGALTIAAGIVIAVVALAAGWKAIQPAQTVVIELAAYTCSTDGRQIECRRK
ncbi:hypothetical protein H0A73_22610 [Alcaligenaceae bacterium]|nr:hypothetical protein [Alcaligenaceae bacterium]